MPQIYHYLFSVSIVSTLLPQILYSQLGGIPALTEAGVFLTRFLNRGGRFYIRLFGYILASILTNRNGSVRLRLLVVEFGI